MQAHERRLFKGTLYSSVMKGHCILDYFFYIFLRESAHEPKGSSLEGYQRRDFIDKVLCSVKDSAISSNGDDIIDDLLMLLEIKLIANILRMAGTHLLQCLGIVKVKLCVSGIYK